MKKINCEIINDILPLYLDGVVSTATKEMVEEHLSSCDSCRKEVALLKKEIALPIVQSISRSETNVFQKLKSHFWKRNVIISISTMIATILLIVGVYSYMNLKRIGIPYNEAIIRIDEIDGKLYATYQDINLGGTMALDPSTVIIDGEEKQIAVFYYYETPWSKYFQPFFEKDALNYSFYLGSKDEIDQIYYGVFKISGSEVDYISIAENSNLIWSD